MNLSCMTIHNFCYGIKNIDCIALVMTMMITMMDMTMTMTMATVKIPTINKEIAPL